MANLTRTDWPLGWVPSSDAVNGNPDGLLRMDNLQRDEFGALTLVKGLKRTSTVGAFDNYVDQIYSKLIGNQEVLWASLGAVGGTIARSNNGTFSDQVQIGGNDRTVFGDALGQVLILAGSTRVKDSGSAQKLLGLNTPGVPTVVVTNNNGGPLNGSYTYLTVAINDNGIYQAKSPAGTVSVAKTFVNGTAVVTPVANNSQATIVEIYRRSIYVDGETPRLSKYYLIGTTSPGASFIDNISDQQALLIGQTANLFLKSLQPLADGNGILEPIYGVEGLFYERMLYMSLSFIYISDRLNPDAVDSRFTIRAFGDPTEKNLWIKKLTNNVVILGTSKNLYEITGTFAELPDGGVDVQLNPIGEQHPPLTADNCATAGTIFYMGSDGVRATNGSNSQLISPQLRSLFQGQNCHGIAPVVISQYARYAMAIGKTRLYITLPLQDGTRWLLIYDLISKTWRLQYTDPVSINVTQSDRVLVGYNTSGQNFLMGQLFDLDSGTGFNSPDGTVIVGQSIFFLTVFDHNQQPRNRKDTFTLKIICDTGGSTISVYMGKDGGTLNFLADVTATGLQTVYIPLDPATITLGFRYAIKIVDKLYLTRFKLYEVTIEYEARPEQLNYLRIPPSNLGTISRKRIFDYALVIDTLGGDVTFTPYIDNSNAGLLPLNSTINTNFKQTFIHYFTQEQIGTDINGILRSVDSTKPFEFYGLNTEEITSEKMPVPAKFLVIPANNYGTPNRKRHTSYKFQINTNGHDVVFTPKLDNTDYSPRTFNTARKTTVEYFFDLAAGDVIGIDIGGTLSGSNFFEFYGTVVPQDVEALPPRLEYFRIPNTNLGTYSRKRITSYAFIIDTYGYDVTFTPYLDGAVSGTPNATTVNTNGKTTFIHYFTVEEIATDVGGYLSGTHPFEFYGLNLEETVSEKLPTPCKFLVIPPNNYGVPNRKRHSSYKFQILTRGKDVIFTPILDGVSYSPRTYNTTTKKVVEYFFDLVLGDIIGIDIGGTLSSSDPFEFYGVVVPQTVEQLPDRLEYYKIPNSNLGSISRKRFVNYAFVIDTYGHNATFTPLIDNSNANILPASTTVNFSGKQTFIHYFTQEQIGTDIGGVLTSPYPFECYGIDPQKIVSEDLPTPVKYLVIPNNNYGTPNRKRHTSYKFQIDTRNKNVKFTPKLDNVLYDSAIFNTSTKTTVDYYFDTGKGDIIGVDIGGILESIEDTPFEFYGVVVPQEVETLPARLEFFRIPNTNFGAAAKKRVRTIPLVLDTRGHDVTYTPIVDGAVIGPTSVFNTTGKITVYHYFSTDSFGTDYGGQLVSPSGNFEFYGFGKEGGSDKFEQVEILPVPKKYDQLGPMRFDKIGKVFSLRVRMIMTGTTTSVPFTILDEGDINVPSYNQASYSSSFTVIPGVDDIYQIDLPKSVNASVMRFVLGPTGDPFHRYDVLVRVATSGMESDSKWVPVR